MNTTAASPAVQPDASPPIRTAAPFSLPRPPWGGTENTSEARPIYVKRFFFDCTHPTAVSSWHSAQKPQWEVSAYRCLDEIPARTLPPWQSDGFFVFGNRRDLVIEVYGHDDGGPSPAQWRGYVDKAIATIPAPAPKSLGAVPTKRVDQKKAKIWAAKLRKLVGEALIMNCLPNALAEQEHTALATEMDRLAPADQGPFETTLLEVSACRACSTRESRCPSALEAIESTDAWIDTYAK
ncbi:hypothetical protein [Pendulispora albinea]|uniref:Uncharacterized protein n=1 Tax=Pendulispora albinea TaxID=2741071 RepID=A0ABZ2M5Q9_9BACT